MEWSQLLSAKRVSELLDARGPSIRPVEDLRTPFDQDYGRAAFSTPVRRLQDKAQVFPLEEHDAVRTRLTHSLEVSSVARGLGTIAESEVLTRKAISPEARGCIPAITATCGLIHDLGNPPFGHAGESAIGSWFAKRPVGFFAPLSLNSHLSESERDKEGRESQAGQDFLYFEGNAQTQRLLSRLQVLADENGLNMTAATLSASCKYIAASHETDRNVLPKANRRQSYKKHGYFASEARLIDAIRRETGTGEARNPLAFLGEAADDIVYATVDVEDGIKKKLLTWDVLLGLLREQAGSTLLESIVREALGKVEPANFDRGSAFDEAMSVAFRSFAIRAMVIGVGAKFAECYQDIMEGHYNKEILYQTDAGQIAKACKDIAVKHVYSASTVLKREVMGRNIIHDLLDLYWEGTGDRENNEFADKIWRSISPNYRRIYENNLASASLLPEEYFRMQLITDQISGMTDTFAVSLHKELFNG